MKEIQLLFILFDPLSFLSVLTQEVQEFVEALKGERELRSNLLSSSLQEELLQVLEIKERESERQRESQKYGEKEREGEREREVWRERERERERERQRESGRDRERKVLSLFVYVCLLLLVCSFACLIFGLFVSLLLPFFFVNSFFLIYLIVLMLRIGQRSPLMSMTQLQVAHQPHPSQLQRPR